MTGRSSAMLAARGRERLRAVAARMLDAQEVTLSDGASTPAGERSRCARSPRRVTLGYLVGLDGEPRLEATRSFRPPNIRHTGTPQPYANYPYAVHASVVEVDRETGFVRAAGTS